MKERQANFEGLRILAMMMIIALHYLVKGQILVPLTEDLSGKNLVLWLIEASCIVAVNLYVFISGYFLVEAEWNAKKILRLISQVLFYTLLIPLLFVIIGHMEYADLNSYTILEYIFPVASEQYWFVTSYIMMYAFAPILAKGAKAVSKKTLQWAIGLLILFFSIEKSILPISVSIDHAGYDYGWFMVLFLIACYCRLYGISWLDTKYRGLCLYAVSVAASFFVSVISAVLYNKTGIGFFLSYMEVPFHYNYIFCLTGAIGLFYAVKQITIKNAYMEKLCLRVAPFTLGVYLLHEHALVRYQWPVMLKASNHYSLPVILWHMFASVMVIFICGILADYVRSWLFEQAGKGVNKQIVLPLLLACYPMIRINQGVSVVDTTYSVSNFQFFDQLDGTWMVATYLSNVLGSFFLKLPFGDSLLGINFYTSLLIVALSLLCYWGIGKHIGYEKAFLGIAIASSMCWCPTTILYNYLTYLVMGAALICLFYGMINNHWGYFFVAGILLGLNVLVRMPNVTQAAFILVVWYGMLLQKKKINQIAKVTGICLGGYLIGFLIPFCIMSMRFGFDAFGRMVYTMFAMTEKAADYKPASMVTGMLGDYLAGCKWMLLFLLAAGICTALYQVKKGQLMWLKALCTLAAGMLVIRFLWGRGMFHYHYCNYGSVYQWVVLILLMTIAATLWITFSKSASYEDKILAAIVFLQILITPLGSNNGVYPIMNNLFFAVPFLLSVIWKWKKGRLDAFRIMAILIVCITGLQGVFFHQSFALQDGVWGEGRTYQMKTYEKTMGMYTTEENGRCLDEIMEYAKAQNMAGKEAIFYGEVPGLGFFLEMPSALSTFWPDLDSYRMVEFEEDMKQIEGKPYIIVSSQIAAWFDQDGEAMNWFGADVESLNKDQKLAILRDFLEENQYEQVFCNWKYAIYQ